MNILNFFGKPENAPFHLGSVETQASNVRLAKIDAALDHLSLAFNAIGTEDEQKKSQNRRAAEAFQGAVRLARNGERAASTVVEAVAQPETTPPAMVETAEVNSSDVHAPEENDPSMQTPASDAKDALLADAQEKVAAALQKAEQK